MKNTVCLADKRREYRIPLAIPATFSHTNIAKPLEGDIENITPYGVLAKTAAPVPKDTLLKLFFKIPQTEEQIESVGTVRWCQMNHNCFLGIEFQDKVSFNLPLFEVTRLFSRSVARTSADYSDNRLDLLQKCVKEHQHLTYWGAILWTFSAPINTLFSQLAGQIGLSSFRLEKFCTEIENSSVDPKLKCKAWEAISTLEPVSSKFNDIASILGLLKKREYVEPTVSTRRIDLNRIVKDRIDSLQYLVANLTNSKCNISFFPKEGLPLVDGQFPDFARCIDFLLLDSYQAMMFGNCTEIRVQSTVEDETIHIDFFNDGTKLFEEEDIVIDHTSTDFVNRFTARDVKNILGLYYALIPLKKHNAYIAVHSESGNNIMSLRIPVSSDS